jgi:hypothetical protein
MALHIVIEFVICEADIALITLCVPGAELASDDRSIPAPVLKDDHLLLRVQGLLDLINEDSGKLRVFSESAFP